MSLKVLGNTERYDFDAFAVRALDVMMMAMLLTDRLVPKKAFTKVDRLHKISLCEFLQAAEKGGRVIVYFF